MKQRIAVTAICLTLLSMAALAQRPTRERHHVEVVSVSPIKDATRQPEGAPFAIGEYEIRISNKTGKDVYALAFAWTHSKGERGVTQFLFDAPLVAGAETVRKLRIPVVEGAIQLKASVFSDGSYEGDAFKGIQVVGMIRDAVEYHKAHIGELRRLAENPNIITLGSIRNRQRGAQNEIAAGLYERVFADAYNLLIVGRRDQAQQALNRAVADFDKAFNSFEVAK